VPPPGGNGTTMVSGRLGQAAAAARKAITVATIATAEKISANRDIEFPRKKAGAHCSVDFARR
jgi:hypothetical protein